MGINYKVIVMLIIVRYFSHPEIFSSLFSAPDCFGRGICGVADTSVCVGESTSDLVNEAAIQLVL